jgi:hypothetical protein
VRDVLDGHVRVGGVERGYGSVPVPLSGWAVPLFHQVRVTLALLFAEPVLLLLLPVVPLLLLLHAAIVSAAAAMAVTASFLEPRMGSHLLMMPGL